MATSPRLAGRYAKSLLLIALERGEEKQVQADMLMLQESINGSRDLQLMLKSPIITGDKKEIVLHKIFDGKISDITFRFIKLLAAKGRESVLAEMVNSFIAQYNLRFHIVSATLTTAMEADAATIEKVRKLLLSMAGNEGVDLKTEVNPEVIGGFVLRYGDMMLDTSVQRKLQLIKKEIQDTSYINKL